MISRHREIGRMRSPLLLLALLLAPIAACSVKTSGLEWAQQAAGSTGATGGVAGTGGTTTATGGVGGTATGGAAGDAAVVPVDARADVPDDHGGSAVGGAGGNGGSGGGADVPGTGGLGGTGGSSPIDTGGGPDGDTRDNRDGSDGPASPDLALDSVDAERRDLLRDSERDRVPDLFSADLPLPDVPPPPPDLRPAIEAPSGEGGLPMVLIWGDEFDSASKTGVDVAKWSYVTWAAGTVNHELQQYSSSLENVHQDGDGHLVIRARYNANAGTYTSGRIETRQIISFGPGHRVEVRAKLPAATGSFPAILLKGDGAWPDTGELAMVEQYGQDKSWFYATAYAPNTQGSGVTPKTKYTFSNATTASAEFHVYALDWYYDHLVFQVDGNVILTSSYAPSSPFYSIAEYLVLDVAVGGDMGGDVDNTAFPTEMVVDYVRVYQF
jgi:hypothetical protein